MAWNVIGGRRRALVRGGALVFAIGAAGVVLAGTPAHADVAPDPTLIQHQVETCAGAGLDGDTLFGGTDDASGAAGSGNVFDQTGLEVTINAGHTASGIVVNGTTRAFVYAGPFTGLVTIEELEAPLDAGKPEGTPFITSWFVCGVGVPPTTPPATAVPPTPTTTPATATTTTTSGPELPETGASVTGPVIAGLTLLAGGVLLLMLMARRRRDSMPAPVETPPVDQA